MDRVLVTNVNEVYVRISCDEGIAHELHSHFTFMVPGAQFSPQYRAKLWNGNIYLFSLRNRQIYRGLVPHIKSFCEERDYEFVYEDENKKISIADAKNFIKTLNITLEPRDYQIEAFTHAINSRRSLLLSPTSSGKSLIIYLIMRYISKKTLIIVPKISLVVQLKKDFADYGFDSDKFIHQIMAGKDKATDKPITISTWQSLYKMPPEYFEQFDLVIGDEAHEFKAKSLISIMTSLTNTKFRVGTTGTLDGTKTNKLVLEGLFGKVHVVTTTKELMDDNHVADFNIKCLLLKHDDMICKAMKSATYQQEIEYLVLNESRNKFISNLAISLTGNTLLLYQYVEKHGKILEEMINKGVTGDRKVFFISGDVNVDDREDIRQIVETETDAIIVASFGTTSTGINIKNLHNIIFASPSKSRVKNLQSIGRGLRKSATKTKATLYDIADDMRYKQHENYTIKHFSERLKIYSEEQFSFKIFKIELKG